MTRTENVNQFFVTIYKNFNERNIEQVIDNMTQDVKWANGMEGGFVYGHAGVREYWTRQFKLVSANVTPMEIKQVGGGVIIKVHQVVHSLQGEIGGLVPLALNPNPQISPLAFVVIGGLISSTLLSRIVTPVVYKLLPPDIQN